MSGRFTVRNTSRYPTDEVRALVKFASQEIDMRAVCVNVKNATIPYRGGAYRHVPAISNAPAGSEYLITIGIGPEDLFPYFWDSSYKSVAPIAFFDWREALIAVAAHEAKHIDQFRHGTRCSEIACEMFEAYMLDRYRAETLVTEMAS